MPRSNTRWRKFADELLEGESPLHVHTRPIRNAVHLTLHGHADEEDAPDLLAEAERAKQAELQQQSAADPGDLPVPNCTHTHHLNLVLHSSKLSACPCLQSRLSVCSRPSPRPKPLKRLRSAPKLQHSWTKQPVQPQTTPQLGLTPHSPLSRLLKHLADQGQASRDDISPLLGRSGPLRGTLRPCRMPWGLFRSVQMTAQVPALSPQNTPQCLDSSLRGSARHLMSRRSGRPPTRCSRGRRRSRRSST